MTARIPLLSAPSPNLRQIEYLALDFEHSIRLVGFVLQLKVQLRHVLARGLGNRHIADGRKNERVQKPLVHLCRSRLAVNRHMLPHVPLSRFRHRLARRRLRGGFSLARRVLTVLDARNGERRLSARSFDRHEPVPAERHPLRPTAPSALNNEDLGTARIYPYPEPGQVPVPEHRVPVLDGEPINGPFRDRHGLQFRHLPLPSLGNPDSPLPASP